MSKKKKKKGKKFTGEVTKTRVIKIFLAQGFKTADKWNAARLQKKIQNLPDLIEGAKFTDKMQKRVDRILNFLSQGQKIIVVDVEDATADDKRKQEIKNAAERETKRKIEKKAKDKSKVKAEVKKTEKKDKSKKQAKKAVAASKEKKNIDKFGSREGTIQAKINIVLTKKPKTMEMILKDAKIGNQQSGHLRNLIEAGYVIKSDKGFALVQIFVLARMQNEKDFSYWWCRFPRFPSL